MKNIYIIFLSTFLLFMINSINVKAQEGTCIIQHKENTYQVDIPFYWHTVTQVQTVNNLLQQETNYSHSTSYIDSSTKCKNITNSVPKIENINGNILSTKTITFYYSKSSNENSQSIYEKGKKLFAPSYNENAAIKTTFISLDNLPPVISDDNLNPTIITSPENIINISYLQLKLTAFDEVDGEIKISVHEDNYTKNCKTLGTYTVTFSATDSSNNSSYLTINIIIKDTTKPVITGQTNITSNMSNPVTINQIKDSLSISDNYYIIDPSSITVHQDTYTGNEQKEGVFDISFKVSDPSDNISDEFIVHINTYDDIPPSITGDSIYDISYKKLLDLKNISKTLIANDNIDESPTIELYIDKYSENYFKIGIHTASFIAKDKNGNTSEPYVININVKDLSKPTIYISQRFIGIDGNANIDIKDIIEIIETNNNISDNGLLSFNIIKDEYSSNKNKAGEYLIELQYEYENGDNINIKTKIIVENYTSQNIKEIKNTPKNNFWSVIKSFLYNLWNFIKYIFSFAWLKN